MNEKIKEVKDKFRNILKVLGSTDGDINTFSMIFENIGRDFSAYNTIMKVFERNSMLSCKINNLTEEEQKDIKLILRDLRSGAIIMGLSAMTENTSDPMNIDLLLKELNIVKETLIEMDKMKSSGEFDYV